MKTDKTKALVEDLKALQSMAKQLDKLKEEEVYDAENDKYVSKASSKHYDLLEERFNEHVLTSAISRGITFDDVIDLIYETV